MIDVTFSRANASFRVALGGAITTPAPEAVLLKTREEFSAYLSNPTRFFDGRFMLYEQFENDSFFEEHDLAAIIVKGEAALVSLERGDTVWKIALDVTDGGHALYFLTLPKEAAITGVELI